MQNLITNIKIWHTANTPPTGAVNTFHAISSPFEKTSMRTCSSMCQEGGKAIPERPQGCGEVLMQQREGAFAPFGTPLGSWGVVI